MLGIESGASRWFLSSWRCPGPGVAVLSVLISVWDWGAVFSMKETHSSGHSFVVERG